MTPTALLATVGGMAVGELDPVAALLEDLAASDVPSPAWLARMGATGSDLLGPRRLRATKNEVEQRFLAPPRHAVGQEGRVMRARSVADEALPVPAVRPGARADRRDQLLFCAASLGSADALASRSNAELEPGLLHAKEEVSDDGVRARHAPVRLTVEREGPRRLRIRDVSHRQHALREGTDRVVVDQAGGLEADRHRGSRMAALLGGLAFGR